MPRGGPDACWLDRMLQTGRPEYLDRDDVDPSVKAGVVAALDRIGALVGEHQRNARVVLGEVSAVPDPRMGHRVRRQSALGSAALRALADSAGVEADVRGGGFDRQVGVFRRRT